MPGRNLPPPPSCGGGRRCIRAKDDVSSKTSGLTWHEVRDFIICQIQVDVGLCKSARSSVSLAGRVTGARGGQAHHAPPGVIPRAPFRGPKVKLYKYINIVPFSGRTLQRHLLQSRQHLSGWSASVPQYWHPGLATGTHYKTNRV